MPRQIQAPDRSQFPKSLRGTLAYNIRLYRSQRQISQEDLAFKCDLDRTYISAIERCRWNVSLGNIERIAEVLDVDPWRLLVPPEQAEKLSI